MKILISSLHLTKFYSELEMLTLFHVYLKVTIPIQLVYSSENYEIKLGITMVISIMQSIASLLAREGGNNVIKQVLEMN